MPLDDRVGMHHQDKDPTVEMSLEGLSEAIEKAADDLGASRAAIDQARVDTPRATHRSHGR
jgi:hypothetical protein